MVLYVYYFLTIAPTVDLFTPSHGVVQIQIGVLFTEERCKQTEVIDTGIEQRIKKYLNEEVRCLREPGGLLVLDQGLTFHHNFK